MTGQRKVAMVVAEFLGTYVLATAMLSMFERTNFLFFSAIAAGLVYGLMVLIFGGVSGSHLNPAITIGLWAVRKVSTMVAVVYLIAQMAAGFVAWRLSQYFLQQSLPKLASGGFHWPAVIAEGVGTMILGLGVAAALKIADPVKKALVSGGSLAAGVTIASLATYGLLNPAVDLAARAWSWAYVVGPIVGGTLGILVYTLVFTQDIIGKTATSSASASSFSSSEKTLKAASSKTAAKKKTTTKKKK